MQHVRTASGAAVDLEALGAADPSPEPDPEPEPEPELEPEISPAVEGPAPRPPAAAEASFSFGVGPAAAGPPPTPAMFDAMLGPNGAALGTEASGGAGPPPAWDFGTGEYSKRGSARFTYQPDLWDHHPGSDFEGLGPRRLFRRMVLGLSASQVFVAACFAAVFNVRGVHETIRANSWVLWVSIPLAVGFFLALKLYPKYNRRHPYNIVLTTAFTLLWSWTVGLITAYTGNFGCGIAAFVVAVVLCSMVAFTFQSKYDLNLAWAGGLTFATALVTFGIMCGIFEGRYVMLSITNTGGLLFSWLLIFHVELLMAGERHQVTPDEYVPNLPLPDPPGVLTARTRFVFCSLVLYLDCINVIIRIAKMARGG